MTRTERSVSPRAILKDRSESKSGYDKSLRKGGAGPHNWGSVRDELELERDALVDNAFDAEELSDLPNHPNAAVRPSVDGPVDGELSSKTSNVTSDDDVEKAREFRAKGLQGNVDLGSIARTSAGARSSPPRGTAVEITRDAATHTLE